MEYKTIGSRVNKIYKINTSIVDEFFDMKYHIKLFSDKSIILSNNIDTAIITAKVYNYLGEQQASWTSDIIFTLDGKEQIVSTINGEASITFNTSVSGDYVLKTNIPNVRNGEIKVVAE